MRADGISWRSLVWASLVLRCSSIFAPFDPDLPPSYCTVFEHLVKSGGSSIKGQLREESKKLGLPRPGQCISSPRSTADLCLAAVHNSTIVMGNGEEIRGAFLEAGRDCEFFTMMRHPIDRAVSAFYYCPTDHDLRVTASRPAKWCGNAEGEEEPLSERFVEFVSNSFRNRAYQYLYRSIVCLRSFDLCEPEHMVDHGPSDLNSQESWELLPKIEEILLSYNAVGIVEEWRLSMQLFDARVKSPVERWDADLQVNGGVQVPAREELKQWAHNSTEVHDLLSADLHIYRFATAIFKQQTAESLGTAWDE